MDTGTDLGKIGKFGKSRKKHENSNFWENISQRKNENETFLVIFQQDGEYNRS